ncbi:acyltransferase family protein [Cellulosimicrobium sp. NPDC057862]|uniref:acyltransferase family protein n=1 Tax=Cellulosimicrobium sp. NPDC057862 TaxID=3346266 RepID=UPI00366B72C3
MSHARVELASSGRRMVELDGLRGVAAIVVLAHHTALVLPAVASSFVGGEAADQGSAAWWLTSTPLRLLVDGPDAVLVFFVLSGLVLTLPVLRSPGYDWPSFYSGRLVRLGVPVLGSIVLAYALRLALPPVPSHESEWVSDYRLLDLSWEHGFRALDLVAGRYSLNNPLWSIRWEMLFSLALPVFVVAGVVLRRRWLVAAAVVVGVGWLGFSSGDASARFLPVFLLGSVIACNLGRIGSAAASGYRGNPARHHALWLLTLVSSLALLLVGPLLSHRLDEGTNEIVQAVAPLGAAGVVLAAIAWRPVRVALSCTPARLAGKYSFSLYLVHVPVIFAVLCVLPDARFSVTAPLSVLLSLLLAVGFYHLVEARSHRWARAVGTRSSAALRSIQSRRPGPSSTPERTPPE